MVGSIVIKWASLSTVLLLLVGVLPKVTIGGHYHEDGSYHEGNHHNEGDRRLGHYHADGSYHPGESHQEGERRFGHYHEDGSYHEGNDHHAGDRRIIHNSPARGRRRMKPISPIDFACMLLPSVKNCIKTLEKPDNVEEFKEMGCCKKIKACGKRFKCVFHTICTQFEKCEPKSFYY